MELDSNMPFFEALRATSGAREADIILSGWGEPVEIARGVPRRRRAPARASPEPIGRSSGSREPSVSGLIHPKGEDKGPRLAIARAS